MSRGSSVQNSRSANWYPELLQHYPVLASLAPAMTRTLRDRGLEVHVPAETIAFDEDSPCSGLTLITAGAVRVVRSGPQGREILLYRVRPGESCILSVSCLLGHATFAARGVVEGELRGVQIPGDLFETMVAESPVFRTFLFGLFGARVSSLLALVEEVAFHRLDRRLAAVLLRRGKEEGSCDLEMTHQDLADQLGSVREIVSRVLESLEEAGGIALGRGKIKLLRSEILAQIAGPLVDA